MENSPHHTSSKCRGAVYVENLEKSASSSNVISTRLVFFLFPVPKFPEYFTYVFIIYWSLISMFLLLLSISQHSPVLPPSWKSLRPCNLPETPRPWYSSATFLSYIPSRRLHKDASHQLWRSWPPSWRIPPSCKKCVGVFPKQKKKRPLHL